MDDTDFKGIEEIGYVHNDNNINESSTARGDIFQLGAKEKIFVNFTLVPESMSKLNIFHPYKRAVWISVPCKKLIPLHNVKSNNKVKLSYNPINEKFYLFYKTTITSIDIINRVISIIEIDGTFVNKSTTLSFVNGKYHWIQRKSGSIGTHSTYDPETKKIETISQIKGIENYDKLQIIGIDGRNMLLLITKRGIWQCLTLTNKWERVYTFDASDKVYTYMYHERSGDQIDHYVHKDDILLTNDERYLIIKKFCLDFVTKKKVDINASVNVGYGWYKYRIMMGIDMKSNENV